jgi:hypothetical protein
VTEPSSPAATWRAVALLVPAVDAPWTGPRSGWRGGEQHRLRREMSADEVTATTRVLGQVPAAIESWSEGAVALDLVDMQTLGGPVRSLTPIGDGRWWVGPQDLPSGLWPAVRQDRIDALFVLWPSDGAMPLCGWGCTNGPGPGTGGAGFSSIVSDGWAGYGERLHPEEGFVHEWLHQVESVLRGRGVGRDVLPDLHDVDRRTSCRSTELPPFGRSYPEHHGATDTWQPWYRDLMTGTVRGRDRDEPECLGLHREHWARSRP